MSERNKPKDPLDHIPEALTWARERAGITRAALAAAAGVSAGLVSEWEKGTRNAGPERTKVLAEILGCPRVVLERQRREQVLDAEWMWIAARAEMEADFASRQAAA